MSVQELPDVTGLSEEQLRGAACVWCGDALDNGTAIDLGPHATTFYGTKASWFPRACPDHAHGGGA